MAWEVGPLSSGDMVATLHEEETARVLEACAGAFDASTRVERHVAFGDPAATILARADELGADEIVIGSRGFRPIKAAMLGSVAYRVVHEAQVPVVVIR
jgi:nucleotide-binding universal stress UspA family protein